MNRRGFLRSGAGSALAGRTLLAGFPAANNISLDPLVEKSPSTTPTALPQYNEQEHRRRLTNIALCEKSIHACTRKHLITSYIPGQCNYSLGEYPCNVPWEITDADVQQLDQLQAQGIGLIQLHEEWNDSQRLFGANKYSPLNPKGFRKFLDLAHQRRMKVIVYASSGFIDKRDPDFRSEWARNQDLVELFYQYARCSPASPSWRAYIIKQLLRIMDEYGLDGIYNDLGYVPLADNPSPPTKDEVLAFPETPKMDGALGDLLAVLYEEVHRRGGIVKLHYGAMDQPLTDLKVYDYLWVGETVDNGDALTDAVKNYPPYVVPCLDLSRAKIAKEDELYLQSVPYMQFPLLLAGKPFTGKPCQIPGVHFVPASDDFWTQRMGQIWEYYQAHPDGPYSYGGWDSVPGRPEARKVHGDWLRQYAPMVEEGTWAWLQVTDSQLIRGPLPAKVVVSVFANRDFYLVLANFGTAPAIVETANSYVSCTQLDAAASPRWRLGPRSLQILKMVSAKGESAAAIPETGPIS